MDRLGLLPQLSFLFPRLLLPRQVRREVFRRTVLRHRLQRLLREFGFLESCNDYDQDAVTQLLIERKVAGVRDRGEAEAVVQAAMQGATVIVDDQFGRQMAARYGLEFHGTLWVLERFHLLEFISAAMVRSDLQRLLDTGFRLPLAEVNGFLDKIGETPIKRASG